MINLVINLRNSVTSKLNRNNNGYIRSSLHLVNIYGEIDFCG